MEVLKPLEGRVAARAGTPAPQCGTGVLARQIAENGLEIGQVNA